MRGSSPTSVEPRHRLSFNTEDTNKRRFLRSKVLKDGDKSHYSSALDRMLSCKFPSLKLVLVIIIIGAFFTLLRSPSIHETDHVPSFHSRPMVDKWIRDRFGIDDCYASHLNVIWDEISTAIEKLTDRDEYKGIGLLNFNEQEIYQWKQLLPDAEHVELLMDYVPQNVTWETLYPEWLDEEEEFEVPTCPTIPKIQSLGKPRLDLIAVKLPCDKSKKWWRDIDRFHLQLEAARLVATAKGYHPVHVLLFTECFRTPNLFSCKELVVREGNAWLYKPNLNKLREKFQLPVGSCELAVPLENKENWYLGNTKREAYATILHSAHVYVCGAIAAAQSI